MAHIDIEILQPLVHRFISDSGLTPSEQVEVLRIAQGFACKDSAGAGDVSPETIRARRKRLYRKLGVTGSTDVTARLLALSLGMIANGERLEATRVPPAAFVPAMPHDQQATF
jgi:DNA-binding CsgD family transcriptional regulator